MVGRAVSRSISVISGVPQGSVLGLLLFLIYVNSVSDLNLSDDSRLTPYADDMLLYETISSQTVYEAPAGR